MTVTQLDLLAPPEGRYQPRWLAFCAATGHDPDVFDGGRTGAAFITWISQNLAAWRKENNLGAEASLTDDDHESFTAYLFSLSATAIPAVTDSDPAAERDAAAGSLHRRQSPSPQAPATPSASEAAEGMPHESDPAAGATARGR